MTMTTTGSSQLLDPHTTETPGDTDSDSDNEGVVVGVNLSESMRQITRDISSNRFYGKSSSIHFIKAVMDVKLEATGEKIIKPQTQRPEFWNLRPVSNDSSFFLLLISISPSGKWLQRFLCRTCFRGQT